MNEMEILRDFCAEATPPEPHRLAPIRAKVVAGFDAAPLPRGQWGQRGQRRQRRRFGMPYLALTGGVAAVAAVATAAALVILPGAGGAGSTSTSAQLDAAVVLHRAAEAALSAPAPGTGQFIYAQVIHHVGYSQTGEGAHSGILYMEKEWVSVTGTRATTTSVTPCSPVRRTCMSRLEPGFFTFTYAELKKLPTVPATLLDYLYREQSESCQGTGFTAITPGEREWAAIYTIMLEVPLLPPRFAAALFTAAAQIPGVTVTRNVTNAAGQVGIAVGSTIRLTVQHMHLTYRLELIFSPHSYRSIGISNTQLQPQVSMSTTAIAVTGTRFVTTAPTAPGPTEPGYRDAQCYIPV